MHLMFQAYSSLHKFENEIPVSTRVTGFYGCGFGGKDYIVDEDLGEINLIPEKYCTKECGRSSKMSTCCKPQPID